MIVFIVMALILITQIILRIVLRKRFSDLSFELDNEMAKFSILPNYKKKMALATFLSILLTLVVLILPIALNVWLHMFFPVIMFFGKLNLLFTYFLAYSFFIIVNLIQNKMLKSYVYEYKVANPEVDESLLPVINLKKVLYSDLCNFFISIFVTLLIVALFIFRGVL